MELHERLTTTTPERQPGARRAVRRAEDALHMLVIGDLGPQLFNGQMDPGGSANASSSTSGGTYRPRRASLATTASA